MLIDCPDRKGLVARVSGLLYERGANILHADQHQDHDLGLFFMRVEWALNGHADGRTRTSTHELRSGRVQGGLCAAGRGAGDAVEADRGARAGRGWRCSARSICIAWPTCCIAGGRASWICEIPVIVSNHRAVERLAAFYGIPFEHVPVTAATRAEAEARQLELLARHEVELVVLARYMQILSPEFVARYPAAIINVHHSFLPAFTGAQPYHAAHARGVKLIGATSHYVTEVLDDGPIIEQDVARISHRDQVEDLVARGRDLERMVLSRAVRWHLDRRILCYGNKTVVFD